MTTDSDIVILGAGAAGLVAAFRAAELGARVLLLEKNRRPGVKILMSGGTRCNITHDCDERGIVEAFGRNGKFLHSALAALGVRQTIELFEAEGVPTKVEPPGKVFPVSNKAADVLDALVRRLERSGASMAVDEPATDVRQTKGAFTVATPRRIIGARAVILTVGGRSYPGSGTTGDGYRFAASFGHTIIPPRPALTPITSPAPWVAELRGVTLPDVVLTLADGGRQLARRRGALLFAHFGLSGPVALDVSREISGHAEPAALDLAVDLLPGLPAPELDRLLQERSLTAGKKQLANVLAEWLPHRLGEMILRLAHQPIDRKATALARGNRQTLVTAIKRLAVPVAGTLGFGKAEVTAGGVALNEVDSRTLMSKKVPGLYFAGELLDLDGPIGGYNFQAAWSTGWLAGTSSAK
jgi:hypothetical protein